MEWRLGKGDECELPATASVWLTDDPQPGLVLVEFTDVYGRPHQLVDKSAIFGGDLLPTSSYPRRTAIGCTIEDINGEIATVRVHWVFSRVTDMPFTFDVHLDALAPVAAERG
ncbi:hypothetical protein VMT65_08665 [Nocardia sp. CDC153]|uniref:hypothetical protein n=1 Tax=Nocardia sp. CDC153 TaxID=3112167 RepID=UPI002DB65E6A|nr:hypothetical protein [Nocardia sp. CDC153]MEC3953099.1 hypothetical protein [Nocardia sp. CDC153]